MAKMKNLREAHPEKNYPQSPGQPGTNDFSIVPLANLGVDSGATAHTGSVIQWEKPKQADHIKLLQFPKPGTSFDRWWDHAIDAISSSTSYTHEAFRWARQIKKPETTFDLLGDSGKFMRLDAILLTALMECIPGDTHYLRQTIKKKKV